MLKFHGTSKSRSARPLWALEELALKYEHIPTEVAKAKSPEHLKINPNGHLPALEDEGTVLWESMAVNLYLAEKYGKGSLWPASVEDHGHTYKWSFWGITEIEPNLMTLLAHKLFLPAGQRDENKVGEATNAFNHANPNGFSSTTLLSLGNPLFDQITAYRDPRIIQLGAKFYF